MREPPPGISAAMMNSFATFFLEAFTADQNADPEAVRTHLRGWWVQMVVGMHAGLLLLGYFATYLPTSVNLEWHLSTSCQRLWLQILPLVLLAVFSGRAASEART